MFHKSVAVGIVLGILMSGCHVSTRESVFMRREAASEPITRQVVYRGHYRLYAGEVKQTGPRGFTPILEARLEKGDRLGFVSGVNGGLLAVVRDEQTPLGSSAAQVYTWTMQADAGQIDSGKTAVLVVVVAAAVIITVVSIANASFHLPNLAFPYSP